jgi:hypothetical protein
MKKYKLYIIFTILLFLPLSVYSQMEWFPIGAEWRYESGSTLSLNPVFNHHYIVEKDTVVEGKICRLIRGMNVKHVVYEENGCVYYYFNNKFRKIYDFTVNVGDIVDLEFKAAHIPFFRELDTTLIVSCNVEKVTTKFIDGIELKEIHTSYTIDVEISPNDWFTETGQFIYLEKVGSEHLGQLGEEFIPHIMYLPSIPEDYYILEKYNDHQIEYISDLYTDWLPSQKTSSNIHLYKSNDEVKLYPNPAKNRVNVSRKNGDMQSEVSILIYDAIGKLVLFKRVFLPCELNIEQLSSGVYYVRINDGMNCLMSNKLIVK